jgi:hypothetical protein
MVKAVKRASTKIGTLQWGGKSIAAVDYGLAVYGAGKATYNLSQSLLDNGKFEWEDTWNLLAYVPFAGSLLGIKKFISANRAKNAESGVDNIVKKTEGTKTTAGNCFIAGTEILTTEGIKNIEDIKVGDWVISDDPNTIGEIEAKQVLNTFVRETTALVDIYIDGEVISTTGEHPFWTPDLGWVEAKDLHVGSLLQTEDGRIIDVDCVEKREGEFEVYNYFVSDLGILVHNANCDDINSSTPTGRRGNHIQVPPPTNRRTMIGEREFSGHALDRMQEQGLVPSIIENAIQTGQKFPGRSLGSEGYYDSVNNISVILDIGNLRK